MTMAARWADVDAVMRAAQRSGVFPGAQLLVGRSDDVLFESAYGSVADGEAPVTAQTLYDVSSLTKPLATLSSLLVLMARGAVALETPVVDVVSEFRGADPRRARVRLRDLLEHASGLPAHRPFYREPAPTAGSGAERLSSHARRERIVALACSEPLQSEPRARAVYSDVGFIVLGAVIERISGKPVAEFVREEILAPLGLMASGFIDLNSGDRGPAACRAVAPCGRCPWREAVVRGVVHDENAYAMGGVAGHAGLFSTAAEVHGIVAELVRGHGGQASLFDRNLIATCWQAPDGSVPGSTWALGWDTPSPVSSSAGSLISKRAVGHLGYTGASVWIDLERGVHVILLSNRVHPDPNNRAIRELRPRVHDAVFAAVG